MANQIPASTKNLNQIFPVATQPSKNVHQTSSVNSISPSAQQKTAHSELNNFQNVTTASQMPTSTHAKNQVRHISTQHTTIVDQTSSVNNISPSNSVQDTVSSSSSHPIKKITPSNVSIARSQDNQLSQTPDPEPRLCKLSNIISYSQSSPESSQDTVSDQKKRAFTAESMDILQPGQDVQQQRNKNSSKKRKSPKRPFWHILTKYLKLNKTQVLLLMK
mmetsp:Transcript_15000/g.20984  ORF Transcript_15000/g.20984 Transcript_15000/m.20984 type:complete len:219 (+) Transcript_15000:1125-1781(+)